MKKFGIVVLVILILLQAYRPAKNESQKMDHDISVKYAVPNDVKQILAKACNDCHSNHTNYPWYNNIEPIGMILANHVNDGKRHLNFNEFSSYSIGRQYKKLDECIDEIKEGGMPINTYTWIHKDAKLNEAEKQQLFNFFNSTRDSIKAKYPADSLLMPNRR